MYAITGAAIARETGLSPMTIHRRLRMLDRLDGRPTEMDALLVVVSQEAEIAGLSRAQSIEMLADHHQTLRWLAGSVARQAWLVSSMRDKTAFSAVAVSQAHLQSLIEGLHKPTVVALHLLVSRARRRVAALSARVRSEAA